MMSKMRRILLALLVAISAPVMAAQDEVWVNVLIEGKVAMGFAPAANREGSRHRGVSSDVGAEAKTRKGEPIRSFELTGWKEGDSYRVLVFALVPNAEINSGGSRLKSVEFADLRLKAGQERAIPGMKEAGVTPWVLRVGRREPIQP